MPLVRVRGPRKRLDGARSEHAIDRRTVGELLRALMQEIPVADGNPVDVLLASPGGGG